MTIDYEELTEVLNVDLEAAVREFAQLFPDVKYDSSANVSLYSPVGDNVLGCIVGAALGKLGFDTKQIDDQSRGASVDIIVPHASLWLQRVQSAQDGGDSTWADAVYEADRRSL
jgi:hypothetical protein